MLTDDQLVRRALSGDTAAFADLVRRHQGLVACICRKLMRDEHEALDMAQEAFVRAYANLFQLRDPDRFAEWLRRVAYTVCLNRLKKLAGEDVVELGALKDLESSGFADTRPGPDRQAESRELAKIVLDAIARLPADYRESLQLIYLEGASPAQAAGRLGLRAGCFRTRLSRARQLLRSELTGRWSVEAVSRTKQLRDWLPSRLSMPEETTMKLEYRETRKRLLRGDEEVTIRPMRREDIPAMRRFDQELTATLDEANAQSPPDSGLSTPGGPWSEDEWLLEHFNKYAKRGNVTLLAQDMRRRIVGFADLWVADEPPPFGRSLDVECIDYFREYFLAGLETVLLSEAEKVACAAGLPALDIGTNTCSGEYVSLRRFGLKVFYEYDNVLCRCATTPKTKRPRSRRVTPEAANLGGLIRAGHWSPTDFTFRSDLEETYLLELCWLRMRAVLELWRFEGGDSRPVPQNPPNKSELFVEPKALSSSKIMSDLLAECTAQAGEVGAKEIQLPSPSDLALDEEKLSVVKREFAFAWLRKQLCEKTTKTS